jgi:hypothetical protein
MTTKYTGPATLALGELRSEGIAQIYQTSPEEWEGEFLRGDPDVLWSLFGENAVITLDDGCSGTVMVQSYGEDSVSLIGSGDWPLAACRGSSR